MSALNVDCNSFLEDYETLNGDLTDQIQLALMDPPYNIRRDRDLPNSAYDILSHETMQNTVEGLTRVVRPGGHTFLFCSEEQHSEWKQLFAAKTYFDENGRELPSWNITPRSFKLIHKPQHFTHSSRDQTTYVDGMEYAFHAKKNGQSKAEDFARVNWRNHGHVNTRYPVTKGIIDNIPRLAPGEQVRAPNPAAAADITTPQAGSSSTPRRVCTTIALRNEQKPLPLLREIVCRHSNKGDKVLDMFSGTFSCLLACITLQEHRYFIGCESDQHCFDIAMEHVRRQFALHIAQHDTSMAIPNAVRDAARRLFAATQQRVSRTGPTWGPPSGLPLYQVLPCHIVAAVAHRVGDPSIVTRCGNIPLDKWPESAQRAFQETDFDFLLSADLSAYGLLVSKSTIRHEHAGMGCFAAKNFDEGDVICHYYGTLTYHDLVSRSGNGEYGMGHLSVDKNAFQINAFQIRTGRDASAFNAVTDLMDGRAAICTTAPMFCAARYINDARYLQGDLDKDMPTVDRRSPNVMAIQDPLPVITTAHLLPNKLITYMATRPVNVGEELFVDYAKDYVLFHNNMYHEGLLS